MIHRDRKLFISFLGFEDTINLPQLKDHVYQTYSYNLEEHELYLDLSRFYDPDRLQYSADGILRELTDISADPEFKILAVSSVDLYIPVLTFIFGQASLGGKAGVMSGYRLKNEFYGLNKNTALYQARLLKIFLHESGHLSGLKHCYSSECIMTPATYVEEVDQAPITLCSNCHHNLSSTRDLGH